MSRLLFTAILILPILAGCQAMTRTPVGWEKKVSTRSDACPDISGTYYDRASETYSSYDLSDRGSSGDYYLRKERRIDELCIVEGEEQTSMYDYCSLWYVFNTNEQWWRGSAEHIEACNITKVEISEYDGSTLYIQLLGNRGVVLDRITYDLNEGYACEDGSIILFEEGGSGNLSYRKNELYVDADGSLIRRVYASGPEGALVFGLPIIGVTALEALTKWTRVEGTINPYNTEDCRKLNEKRRKRIEKRLKRYLKRITQAYSEKKISEESYRSHLDGLIQKHGQDKVNKALQEIQK
jgi:hypothetical protein